MGEMTLSREKVFAIAAAAEASELSPPAFGVFAHILVGLVDDGVAPDFRKLVELTEEPENLIRMALAELVGSGWLGRAGVSFRWPS